MELTQISLESLDSLFGDTPSTPDQTQSGNALENAAGSENIPTFDLDSLEDVAEDTPTDETPETPEEVKPDETPEETTKADEVETPEAKKETDDTPDVSKEEVNTLLKKTVDFLVEQGQWEEFEGRNETEITPELYSELALKQNENAALKIFNDLVDTTGAYGKAIISHIKEGGNPEEIIDLFKEQKQLENFNTSTDEGKIAKIEKYYSEIIGWKPEKVKRHLERISADNEIDSELVDVEEKYDEFYSRELEALEAERIQKETLRKKNQEEFSNKIKNIISSNKEYTDSEKKILEKNILSFDHKLENGSKVNTFYVKFAEMQADPEKYVKLVHFVTDQEGYEKKIKSKTETKAAIKNFDFIKGNAAVSKKGSSAVQTSRGSDNAKPSIDFGSLIKH